MLIDGLQSCVLSGRTQGPLVVERNAPKEAKGGREHDGGLRQCRPAPIRGPAGPANHPQVAGRRHRVGRPDPGSHGEIRTVQCILSHKGSIGGSIARSGSSNTEANGGPAASAAAAQAASITTTVQGWTCGEARRAARRLAWERLARSLHSCVSSSHRSSSAGPNRSRGSISRTTR